MDKVDLRLELASQILDVLLLPLHVNVKLLRLSSEPRVLISGNVVLDFEVPVHVADLLFLHRPEDWRLVSLDHIGGIH